MSRIRGDLLERTFSFARRILKLSSEFPNDPRGWVLAKQLIRSGTSIGANIREADNAMTDADFSYKCSVARKEAVETHYWLELCTATDLLSAESTEELVKEADEITRILSTIVQKTQVHIRHSRER